MYKYFLSSLLLILSVLCPADETFTGSFPHAIALNPEPSGKIDPKSNIDQRLADKIHYNQQGGNNIGFLYIGPNRPIDHTTYLQVKFALEEYKKRGVIFVLMRLNTPGGEVLPAMRIAELLQQFDRENDIPVVGIIYNWALSAGAMLAYSCRFLIATESAIMGAAEPVISAHDGKMESASEKIVSGMRAEFASLAKFYARNPLIAEAMVDKDMVLVKREGRIIKLQNNQEIRSEGDNPDQVIVTQGKLLTLDAEQLLEYGVADIIIPILATPSITPEQHRLGEWSALQTQPFHYPFFAKIPYLGVIYYHSWKVSFFSFLTHPVVSSLLMMGLLIGIYLEMSHPGFGLPGITALGCLALILISGYAVETVNWLETFFIGVGILLILAEIFILPGFGILAVLGILLVLFGLIAILLPHLESFQFSWNWEEWNLPTTEFMHRLGFYLGALLLTFIIIAVLARFVTPYLLKKSPLVLGTDQEGSVAGIETKDLPKPGVEGEAFTSLRPGGKILINFHLYDALTEGTFVNRGEKVVVSKIQGSVIIVMKKEILPPS